MAARLPIQLINPLLNHKTPICHSAHVYNSCHAEDSEFTYTMEDYRTNSDVSRKLG